MCVPSGNFVHEVMGQVLAEVHMCSPNASSQPNQEPVATMATKKGHGEEPSDRHFSLNIDSTQSRPTNQREISVGTSVDLKDCGEELHENDLHSEPGSQNVSKKEGCQGQWVKEGSGGVDKAVLESAGLTVQDLTSLLVRDKDGKTTLITDLGKIEQIKDIIPSIIYILFFVLFF